MARAKSVFKIAETSIYVGRNLIHYYSGFSLIPSVQYDYELMEIA
jgi:hypothetical protein